LMILSWSLTHSFREKIALRAIEKGLPTIYGSRRHVLAGGLISYGVSVPDLYRRAAIYVDKILKGTKPSSLPVEFPTRFRLSVNLKTADALGLTIPPSILLRADEVIE
ncbi:MAG: ABC transporter substrate binding protein, partial [Desulfobulbia bacterium]